MKFDIVISLCDGIGLARDSLAVAAVRYDRYIAVEIDETARKIADWRGDQIPSAPVAERPYDDIRAFPSEAAAILARGKRVLFIAGIPCTERSLANKKYSGAGRVGKETDSGLIRDFCRILTAARTTAKRVDFIVENVPSAAAANDFYSKALSVAPVEINAADFGAQHRNRLFWASWYIAPPKEWSPLAFASIAEHNPADANYYDFIIYPSAREREGKPHRLGVLATRGVLKQIAKNQTKGGGQIVGGLESCGEASAAVINPNKKTRAIPATAFKRKAIVASLPDGGGDQSVVADATKKIYAVKGRGVKVSGAILGAQGKRVHDARKKITTHGRRGGDGSVVVSNFLRGTPPAQPQIYSDDAKCAAIKAGASKGRGGVLIHASLQDRVYDGDGKIKTIPAHGGGRTEGVVATGDIDRLSGVRVQSPDKKANAVVGPKTRKFVAIDSEPASARIHSKNKKSAAITRNKNGLAQYIADGDAARVEMRQKFKLKSGEVITLPRPVPVLINGARTLTVLEIERLFNLPDGATACPGVSRTARIRALGGGWCVLQMAHCLKQITNKQRTLL